MGASLPRVQVYLFIINGRKSTKGQVYLFIINGRKSTLLNRGATLPEAHDSEGVTIVPPII